MTYRSSSKMVAIDQFLEELCFLRDFTVFRTFLSLLIDINLIFGTLLCHTNIQINFEFGFDLLIFHEVLALGLRKTNHELSVLRFFFSYSFDIWYIALPYVVYRSNLSLVLIHWFFTKLWPLDLEKKSRIVSFQHFLCSAYRYSFDIWNIALPYLDTDSVWVWLWSIDFSRSYGSWT
jgi:hypothetical protein